MIITWSPIDWEIFDAFIVEFMKKNGIVLIHQSRSTEKNAGKRCEKHQQNIGIFMNTYTPFCIIAIAQCS